MILQTCQKMGAKPETFERIAKGLEKKSADEVGVRTAGISSSLFSP